MRDLTLFNECRVDDGGINGQNKPADPARGGWFLIPSPIDNVPMRVVASADRGWDHVSVSREDGIPNWLEMSYVHRLFFKDGETAMQLHVPSDDHINLHQNCLHLWRPRFKKIPRPPQIMV